MGLYKFGISLYNPIIDDDPIIKSIIYIYIPLGYTKQKVTKAYHKAMNIDSCDVKLNIDVKEIYGFWRGSPLSSSPNQ